MGTTCCSINEDSPSYELDNEKRKPVTLTDIFEAEKEPEKELKIGAVAGNPQAITHNNIIVDPMPMAEPIL